MATMGGIFKPEPEGGLILACSIFPDTNTLKLLSLSSSRLPRRVDTHVSGSAQILYPQRSESSAQTRSQSSQDIACILCNLHLNGSCNHSCSSKYSARGSCLVCAHFGWHDRCGLFSAERQCASLTGGKIFIIQGLVQNIWNIFFCVYYSVVTQSSLAHFWFCDHFDNVFPIGKSKVMGQVCHVQSEVRLE